MWIFTCSIIYIIAYSRIILAVHSIEQVCFGLVLGFALYYFYFHINKSEEEIDNVVYVHNMGKVVKEREEGLTLLERMDVNAVRFIAMLGGMIVTYIMFYNKAMTGKYLEVIDMVRCPVKRYGVKLPAEKSFILCFSYLGVVGAYYALRLFGDVYEGKYVQRYIEYMKDKEMFMKTIHYCGGWIVYVSILWFVYRSRLFAFWFKVPCFSFICGYGLFGVIGILHVVLFGWGNDNEKPLDINTTIPNGIDDIFINISNMENSTHSSHKIKENENNDDDNENVSLI